MIDSALALNLSGIAKRESSQGNQHIAEVLRITADAVRKGVAEIERLQDAKRRALAIADERAKENERLRAAIKPFAEAWDAVPEQDYNVDGFDSLKIERVLYLQDQPTMADLRRAAEAFSDEQKADQA